MRAGLLAMVALGLFALGAQAAEPWRQALDRAAAQNRYAQAFLRDGDTAAAEKAARDGLKALPPQVPPAGQAEARQTSVQLYRRLADVQQIRGRMDDARASLLLAKVQAHGDAEAEADVTNDVGLLDWTQGKLDEAEQSLTAALEAYQSLKVAHMQAVVRGNLGLIALDRFTATDDASHLKTAEGHFTQARDVFVKEGAKDDLANQWSNLGLVYRHQKKFVQATKAHQEGLKLDRAAGNRIGEVDSIGNLGRVAEDSGDIWKARDLYRQAFDLAQRVGYARGIAHHGLYLMVLLNHANRPAEARPYGPPALAAAESLGKPLTIDAIRQQIAVSGR
ncbi:MAG: tetratricopeptide repeat protein [Bacteroidota bacterium]